MDKYCVCIKNEKNPIKIENIRPVKMLLLCGINDIILIYHPSFSCVYQEKYKMQELQQEINNVLGSEPNQKTDKTVVHVSPSKLGIFNRPAAQLNGCWCSGIV